MVTPDGPVRMEAIMKSARSPLCVEISTWAHEPHFISSKASLLCYTGIDREINIWGKNCASFAAFCNGVFIYNYFDPFITCFCTRGNLNCILLTPNIGFENQP